MVKVKICGITNLRDAQASIKTGCDALGFVFYKKSCRYIAPQQAREIIKNLPKDVIKIGVFANSTEKRIKNIAKSCGLDILQFHGSESAEFCDKFKNYKVIKAFRVRRKEDLKNLLRYKVFAFLFDAFVKSEIGGTGRRFNWELIKDLDDIKQAIFLSGGLNYKNVKQAIKSVYPDWVDASSSLEIKPGKKNHNRVKEFIRAAKSVSLS